MVLFSVGCLVIGCEPPFSLVSRSPLRRLQGSDIS